MPENNIDINYDEKLSDIIQQLKPVSFISKLDGFAHVGLIAEDVAEVDSRLVEYGEDGEPESVQYDRVVAPLIAKVKEQDTEIEELKSLIKRLEKL